MKKALVPALSGAILLLVAACAVLACLLVDRSISLAHALQSADSESRNLRNVEAILEAEWRGLSHDAVLDKLRASSQSGRARLGQVLIKTDEDGTIWFDEVEFKFESARLAGIGR